MTCSCSGEALDWRWLEADVAISAARRSLRNACVFVFVGGCNGLASAVFAVGRECRGRCRAERQAFVWIMIANNCVCTRACVCSVIERKVVALYF